MPNRISETFDVFHDLNGDPLSNGYVYIGTASQNPETQPITVYWDSALSVTATQPIRTINGRLKQPDGTPGTLYTSAADFSITVRDSQSRLVASKLTNIVALPVNAGGTGATTASGAQTNLGLGTVATEDIDVFSVFCTTGGSANAVELTTGASLSALATGMKFRFIPDSNNTLSTTINVDGIGAVTCKTVTGSNLPANYLRASVMSECWYDGTNIIVDRLPEYQSNAAGKYWRYANGHAVAIAQYANLDVNVSGAVGFRNNGETKNMPMTFAELPNGSGSSSDTTFVWINARASSTSVWTIGAFSASSQTGVDVELIATGRWYT